MSRDRPIVYVIDDDLAVREGLRNLFRSVGYECRTFETTEEFPSDHDRPACLVLDVRMPGRNGLDFQRDLHERHNKIPVIFLTGHGDVPMSVRAMKDGATEFLLKPFREQELLDAVQAALDLDAKRNTISAAAADVIECYAALSPRERRILQLVNIGCLSKDIGQQLGLKEITIKVHRAKAMKKMKADSLVALLQKLALLKEAGVGEVE